MNEIQPYRIAVVISEKTAVDGWVELALRMLPADGEINVRGMITIPKHISLSEGTTTAQNLRDNLNRLAQTCPAIHETPLIRVDYHPLGRILEELGELKTNLVIIEWQGPEAQTGGLHTDQVLQNTPCDVALIYGEGWQREGSVLLSLRGGPNITLGMQVARGLAGNAPITLFHATDILKSGPDLKPIFRAEPQISRVVTSPTEISSGLVHELADHKVVVMGATFYKPQSSSSASGEMIRKIYQQSNQTPIALVRAFQPESLEFHAPRFSSTVEESLSTRVDRWFAENTFKSDEFADIRQLMALKEKQGTTISLGLPALDEEETVGKIIQTMKKTFMDDFPLLDEIVLIDSDSSDNTIAVARDCGIPTYKHPEILPEVGSNAGKGEALWKSLYVLKGDIIAWIDTDITNIHPRFVYGIVGPLLKHPHIQYVKGFYQRPIQVGEQLQAYGGGRVTELVARPWLNLFYPELSGLIQPLSGEYAGRRSALEQVPFFSGYGVETGLLIDLLEKYGLEGIAQTDLEQRIHHNQNLVGLSKMSFAILQVFIARLERRHSLQLLEKANRSMKLVVHAPQRFALGIHEISDVERPPMASIPAYRELWKLTNGTL